MATDAWERPWLDGSEQVHSAFEVGGGNKDVPSAARWRTRTVEVPKARSIRIGRTGNAEGTEDRAHRDGRGRVTARKSSVVSVLRVLCVTVPPY